MEKNLLIRMKQKLKIIYNYNMDIENLGFGVGGGLAVVIVVYLFKFLMNKKINIKSGCMEVKIEEDRTPKENQVVPLENIKIEK